jgi:Fe2+ transport system protein B
MATESVREAVIDGKKQIDEASSKIKTLEEQNKTLQLNLGVKEANLAIDRLTEGLPATKKRHMAKVFDGKSAKFINENFKYTLDMFEKSEKDKLETLKEQATETKSVADRPVSETKKVVQESVEKQIEQTDPNNKQDRKLFDNYMGELTRW